MVKDRENRFTKIYSTSYIEAIHNKNREYLETIMSLIKYLITGAST